MSSTKTLEFGDHDFLKVSIVPSVSFLMDIPNEISESWYTGQVTVSLKESVFEPSFPF